MGRLNARSFDSLHADTVAALAPISARGPLASIWLEFAASEPALRAYLAMEQALDTGSLDPQQIEAIKLRVSTLNNCAFCIATHRAKSRALGMTSEMITAAREGGGTADAKIDAMLAIVNALFDAPGTTPQALIDSARAEGVDDAALMDLAMAVTAIFFTNIANHINDTRP